MLSTSSIGKCDWLSLDQNDLFWNHFGCQGSCEFEIVDILLSPGPVIPYHGDEDS